MTVIDREVRQGTLEATAELIACGSRNIACVIRTDNRKFVIEDPATMDAVRQAIAAHPRRWAPNDVESGLEVFVEYSLIIDPQECSTDRGLQTWESRTLEIDAIRMVQRIRHWDVTRQAFSPYRTLAEFSLNTEATDEIREELADEILNHHV